MSKIFDTVLQAVGDTPLVKLNRVTADIAATVCVKIEAANPGGSVKDRIALAVVEDAEKRGLLKPGGTLVEPTSGNMGVALAIVAAVKGYKCIFTIPDKMSGEKIRRLRAFGAEVVVTPTAVAPDSPESYYSVARRITDEIPGGRNARPEGLTFLPSGRPVIGIDTKQPDNNLVVLQALNGR
jgi:cystathionine beta-synthase